MKSLKFEAENIVTQGISYALLFRNNKADIDLLGGTYSYLRIEAAGLVSPLKLTFTYKSQKKALMFYYSRFNPKPAEKKCERFIFNPSVVVIKALDDNKFVRSNIYFKF